MSTQNAPAKNAPSSETAQAKPQHPKAAFAWSADPAEREWERSLFLVPQQLSEARRRSGAGRGVGGLLLASVLGVAILVGDVRGEEPPTSDGAASESQDAGIDYWAWLQDWINGGPSTDSQKSGGSSNDPEGGED